MKDLHHGITAVVLSILFVLVGFAATMAAVLGPSGGAISTTYSLLGYILTLLAFLIILWIVMLVLMHNDPHRMSSGRRRR